MAGAAPINQDQASTQSAAKMARGELVKVDTDSQTFTIKQDNGEQAQFQYTADTKVEGAQTSMQGLATDTGSITAKIATFRMPSPAIPVLDKPTRNAPSAPNTHCHNSRCMG